MTDDPVSDNQKSGKGGRKGGAIYPQYPLGDVLPWVRKLVSKTHVDAQSKDVIYSGVVGAKSGHGNVRISSLKQFGFMEVSDDMYMASDLAKKIVAAPDDELPALYAVAALKPKTFASLYNTFHGDVVSRAKLRQRVADLDVHPDKMDDCVHQYVSSLQTAQLATVDGDKVVHVGAVKEPDTSNLGAERLGPPDVDLQSDEEGLEEGASNAAPTFPQIRNGRANINVTIALDSSLDIDKLEKQLSLLKRYGAI